MKRGEQERQVRTLMAEGFGKAKCTQALKDAGNNIEVARRILIRQRQAAEELNPRSSAAAGAAGQVGASNNGDVPFNPSIPSLTRASKPAAKPIELSATQKKIRRQRERKHPCVVQYGSCQYGDFCLLKDFPGDVCVQYFHGSCIYGEGCRHRHVVDGVDVRDVMKDALAAEEAALLLHREGTLYRVREGDEHAKVQVAEAIGPYDGPREAGAHNHVEDAGVIGGRVLRQPPPQPSDFNQIRGSIPTYTEPLLSSAPHGTTHGFASPYDPRRCTSSEADGEVSSDASSSSLTVAGSSDAHGDGDTWTVTPSTVMNTHPTPFRDLARAAGAAGAATTHEPTATTTPAISMHAREAARGSVLPAASFSSPARFPPTGAASATAKHPCIAQYGSCKFGDACAHADRDADVCVHFLNGRCRYSSEECHYRHESAEAHHASLLARAGLPQKDGDRFGGNTSHTMRGRSEGEGGMQAASTMIPGPSSIPSAVSSTKHASNRPKNRLQGGNTTPSAGSAGGRTRSSATASPSPLPSFGDLNALTSLSRVSSACDVAHPHDAPHPNPNPNHHQHGHTSPAVNTSRTSDNEMRVFLGLLEAYPSLEPAVVLQALRVSGGDPIQASDFIHQLGVLPNEAELENVAAALALAAAEEEAEREAATEAKQHAVVDERHNALLTLLSLFPTVEAPQLEAMLTQQKNDFAAVYNTLLCAQENVLRGALWRGSTATMAPADQLRVQKLQGMFPGLDAEVVRSAYCAADCDWTRATSALNELTKELLSLKAVESAKAGPVVWRPPINVPKTTSHEAHAASPGSFSPPPMQSTADETSEEAYMAYRDAALEILEYGDWRQVREQAYLINSQRIRLLSQAAAAYTGGDGRTAKVLSREGRRLAIEYNRLNRLAMLALEQERLCSDAISTLDLHGFHMSEVHDVVVRRVEVCRRKRVGLLRIVVGEGRHSKRGHGSLYTALMEELKEDAYLARATKVKSVKAGYVDVAVHLPLLDA